MEGLGRHNDFSLLTPNIRQQAVDGPLLMHEPGPQIHGPGCETHDATDTFVAENFAELKARGVFGCRRAEPAAGGGGRFYLRKLCDMLRALVDYCGSTALTLSMTTHFSATTSWRWRRDPKPVEGLL